MKPELTGVILCGGLGTRLANVLTNAPKPMAPVASRPFLEYLVAQVRDAGCSSLVLCVGHLGQVIQNHFRDGRDFGISIRYSCEKDLLGTAGALALALPLVESDPFLVFNGDSYCPADLAALHRQHRDSGAIATIVVAPVNDASRFGTVALGPENSILGFLEKGASAGTALVNAGIYLLSKRALAGVPPNQKCSLETSVFPSLAGHGLCALRQETPFIDIGTPDSLRQASVVVPELGRLPGDPASHGSSSFDNTN